MKTRILILVPIACAMAACGNNPSDHQTTAAEKKAFAGGPMPADALKRFQDSQAKSAELVAAHSRQAKAKAAGAGP